MTSIRNKLTAISFGFTYALVGCNRVAHHVGMGAKNSTANNDGQLLPNQKTGMDTTQAANTMEQKASDLIACKTIMARIAGINLSDYENDMKDMCNAAGNNLLHPILEQFEEMKLLTLDNFKQMAKCYHHGIPMYYLQGIFQTLCDTKLLLNQLNFNKLIGVLLMHSDAIIDFGLINQGFYILLKNEFFTQENFDLLLKKDLPHLVNLSDLLSRVQATRNIGDNPGRFKQLTEKLLYYGEGEPDIFAILNKLANLTLTVENFDILLNVIINRKQIDHLAIRRNMPCFSRKTFVREFLEMLTDSKLLTQDNFEILIKVLKCLDCVYMDSPGAVDSGLWIEGNELPDYLRSNWASTDHDCDNNTAYLAQALYILYSVKGLTGDTFTVLMRYYNHGNQNLSNALLRDLVDLLRNNITPIHFFGGHDHNDARAQARGTLCGVVFARRYDSRHDNRLLWELSEKFNNLT